MQAGLDIDRPPYRQYVDMLEAMRADREAWTALAFAPAHDEERSDHDAHELDRARVAHILQLCAQPSDLELVRFLLDQEIEARGHDSFQGAGEALTILSLLTLEFGDASDTWRFWRAKTANFDTWAGGYDIEFVFASLAPDELLKLARERGTTRDVERLEERVESFDPEDLEAWRERLPLRFPRSVDGLRHHDCEAWAGLFDDEEAVERLGLLNAEGPVDRAYVYQRLERYEEAVKEWRAAARDADEAWNQASYLQSAISAAAKVGLPLVDAVEQLDGLRSAIGSWTEVGLGRMATQACFELAANLDDPQAGERIWTIAEAWRVELRSFPLVGLEAAVAAAEKWGSPSAIETVQRALREEREHVDRELARLGLS